jgi:hypothetical protein
MMAFGNSYHLIGRIMFSMTTVRARTGYLAEPSPATGGIPIWVLEPRAYIPGRRDERIHSGNTAYIMPRPVPNRGDPIKISTRKRIGTSFGTRTAVVD